MTLNEAEIQVLASLRRAEIEAESSDKTTLEEHGKRYGVFREDWSNVYGSLIDGGLIAADEAGYRLTEAGRLLGDRYHRERPDHYWYYYQRFYQAADASQAHSRLCQRVYGEDWCQEGQTDMPAFNDLLNYLDLKPGDHLLDLGCGSGGLCEYASDRTGAMATGIDNSASAIATANARTEEKRDRLTFLQADMNSLELPPHSFDAAISLDTLYWVADIVEALSSIVRVIKPRGQLGIFIEQKPEEGGQPDVPAADKTWVALALSRLNLAYETHDYSVSFREFWPRVKQAAEALREEFEAEGNEFICSELLREADNDFLPALRANQLRRYLYLVDVPRG